MRIPRNNLRPLHRAARGGVSLLEVVISIFVSAVGLLGIAALIPAGQIQLQRANISDHGSALGRKALAEARLRGLLDPTGWYLADGNPLFNQPVTSSYPVVSGAVVRPYYDAPGFVLDPYGLTRGSPTPIFPMAIGGGLASAPTLVRVAPFTPGNNANNVSLASAMCLLPDDLLTADITDLNAAGNRNAEPVQVFDDDGLRAKEGRYSWLITLVRETNMGAIAPQPYDAAFAGSWYTNPHRYIVSAAVVFSRVAAPETKNGATVVPEMATPIDSSLMGPTGGFVTIRYGADANAGATAAKLRAGEWIMLGRWRDLSNQGGDLSPRRLYWARWYRIASIDDEDGAETRGFRELNVSGPDWPPPFPKDSSQNTDFAYLIPGVTGVYEETLDLPTAAPFTATVP